MATYLEIKNDEQITQIGDTYEVQCVVRKGQVNANINSGQIYGFALNKNEKRALFNVDSGDLIVSPPFLFNGDMIHYIASTGSPINYVTLGMPSDLSPQSHGAGMEVYDSNGKMVFSSFYEQVNYKGAVPISPDPSIFTDSARDSHFEHAIGQLIGYPGAERYPSYTYNGDKRAYVCVQNAPFLNSGGGNTRWTPSYICRHLTYGRFTYSSPNSFTVPKSLGEHRLNSLLGVGSLDQLSRETWRGPDDGPLSGQSVNYSGCYFLSYYFNIFESVS